MPRIPLFVQNTPPLKKRRQKLRNDPTPAEERLWKFLRRRQVLGKKFRRQYSIERYIIDFYCPECMLAIELDGAAHYTVLGDEYDAKRSQHLKSMGIEILRFENREVFKNLDGVPETIEERLKERKVLVTTPLGRF